MIHYVMCHGCGTATPVYLAYDGAYRGKCPHCGVGLLATRGVHTANEIHPRPRTDPTPRPAP